MRIAYATIYDSRPDAAGFGSINRVGHYIHQALESAGAEVVRFGPLRETFGPYYWAKQILIRKLSTKTYNRHREMLPVRDFGRQLAARLAAGQYDVVLSPVSSGSQPVAYLKCPQPIVIWTDSTLASAIENYPALSWESSVRGNLRAGLRNERAALSRAALVIYPSEWAANDAIRQYQLDPAKVKVVPFGGNLDCCRTEQDVQRLIESRPADRCRLLFVGLDWPRKGGPAVLEAARLLQEQGVEVELTIVGCNPFGDQKKPDFVQCLGILRRQVPEECRRLDEIFGRSHFLFTPSRGEAFGHVFAEASSYGVPSITTNVNGIPSVVRDGVNGRTFPLDTSAETYARTIASLFRDLDAYRRLACSSFVEYQARLNWPTAGRSVLELMRALPASGRS